MGGARQKVRPASPGRSKITTAAALARIAHSRRRAGARVVFTNGCFDLVHPGHVRYLRDARALGDVLIVALNSDASVRRLKGPGKPVVPLRDRAEVMAALEMVDFVTAFSADTPRATIRLIRPDVLVKGGDWAPDQIVGSDLVQGWGGEVHSLPFAAGYSTARLLRRIARARGAGT